MELRYFGGLTESGVGETLEISLATVKTGLGGWPFVAIERAAIGKIASEIETGERQFPPPTASGQQGTGFVVRKANSNSMRR